MLHRKLDYSAFVLSKLCHLLPEAALLWAGAEQKAVLAFQPVDRSVCFTVEQLRSFIAQGAGASDEGSGASNKAIELDANKGWHRFRSGWLGYFSYEAGHALVTGVNRTPEAPLAEFFDYAFSVVLDFNTDECELVYRAGVEPAAVLQLLESALDTASVTPDAVSLDTSSLNAGASNTCSSALHWAAAWNADEYQQAFAQVQAYLHAGDCYQVNLAMPFLHQADLRHKSPFPLLHSFNPAFGGYLQTAYLSLYTVSPERFIGIDDQRLEARPIKGTAARGANDAEDEANKAWLASSEKNQAENLMIVDLLRNDLSRYALPHSVKVDKLFAIETHANVHHMVSTISATKRPTVSHGDVIVDALPGGSITGAPKKRAMEVIDELETGARGPYCGVMGFFDDSGFSDFNILIRTVVAKEEGAQCWAGGGVVLDSTCDEEWNELHTKVARILEQF